MSDFWHIPKQPDQGDELRATGIASTSLHGPYEANFVVAGRFVIHSLIGSGGTGSVYRATDREQDREIALKVLHPSLIETAFAIESFLKEAKLSIALKHPDILRVYDAINFSGGKALSMELLNGGTLRNKIEPRLKELPYTAEEVSPLILPAAAALSYAHRTTIHCDIKPENIGITDNGNVKLMDFGIAKLRQSHSLTAARTSLTQYQAGTPYYMAPEQIKNPQHVDARVDQYAIGIIIYELFTGEPPIGLAQPLKERRPDLPSALASTVDRAVSSNPDHRFPDMDAMVESLDRGFNQAKHPVMRQLTSGRTQNYAKRISLVAGLIIAFAFFAQFLSQKQTAHDIRTNELWKDLATLEVQQESQRQWHREQALALHAALDSWQAIPVLDNPGWLVASNRWHLSNATIEASNSPSSASTLDQRQASLDKLRHLIAFGHLKEAQARIDQIKMSLQLEQVWIDQAETIIKSQNQAAALLKSAETLQSLIGSSERSHLSETFAASRAAKEAGEYETARKGFHFITQRLSPIFQHVYQEARSQLDQSRHRWQQLYPDLEPKALSFIADPEKLAALAHTWAELSRHDHAIELIEQAQAHYAHWAADMEQLLQRTAPSWNELSDRIENSIGMRFSRIDNGYLSIWETRVVDFARFVSEIPSAGQEAGDTWKNPGFPQSPISPVVGISRAIATKFAGWLQGKFPKYRVECGLPDLHGLLKSNPNSLLPAMFGPHYSILVDPSQWTSGHFQEHYQDQVWSAQEFIGVVALELPNRHGIFDLDGNVWEWHADDFQYQDNEPSAYKYYPILRGGAAGTVTYQGYQPPDPNMKFVLRKEVIGFRVQIGASPVSREIF